MRRAIRARRSSAAAAVLAAAVVAGACTDADETPGAPPGSPTVPEMAEALGSDVVEHLARGYVPDRSTDVAFVPKPNNVVVRWSGVGLGTDRADPRTTHSTPWDYHQRVPIILYGPGFIREGKISARPVDLTDIAATLSDLLGSDFEAPDGSPLDEALVPAGRRKEPPAVIAYVAYDGGGWNLLEEWPDAWPEQRRLAREGSVFTNATIGSAPSVTSAIHANMGTGAYPRTHGLPEITGRLPDGSIGDMYFGPEMDPRLIEVETLADRWDLENGNEPWIGLVAYESWHLGMMSHGSQMEEGDRDVAVLWEREEEPGHLMTAESFYEMPGYLPGDEVLQSRLRELDGSDGAVDGSWMGHDLSDPAVIPATPAFVHYQGDAIQAMLDREDVGGGGPTDMLFVELKPTDFGAHLWNMVAPEEEFTLRAQDEVLAELAGSLDRVAGEGRWVMVVTADHGVTPIPESTGGLRIHPDILGVKIDEYFGMPVVEKVTPSGLYLDRTVMAESGVSASDVARFVGAYRFGDGLPEDADRSAIPAELLDATVFAGALPGDYLGSLTEAQIDALGPGDYPEGDLTSEQSAARFGRLLD